LAQFKFQIVIAAMLLGVVIAISASREPF